jgi:hypothetical protein
MDPTSLSLKAHRQESFTAVQSQYRSRMPEPTERVAREHSPSSPPSLLPSPRPAQQGSVEDFSGTIGKECHLTEQEARKGRASLVQQIPQGDTPNSFFGRFDPGISGKLGGKFSLHQGEDQMSSILQCSGALRQEVKEFKGSQRTKNRTPLDSVLRIARIVPSA